MQKVFIKNTRVAVQYASFLCLKGKSVKYVACFENKAILEVDMHPCNLPVLHKAQKENNAGR